MKSFKKGIALIAVLAFLITAILPVSGLAAPELVPADGTDLADEPMPQADVTGRAEVRAAAAVTDTPTVTPVTTGLTNTAAVKELDVTPANTGYVWNGAESVTVTLPAALAGKSYLIATALGELDEPESAGENTVAEGGKVTLEDAVEADQYIVVYTYTAASAGDDGEEVPASVEYNAVAKISPVQAQISALTLKGADAEGAVKYGQKAAVSITPVWAVGTVAGGILEAVTTLAQQPPDGTVVTYTATPEEGDAVTGEDVGTVADTTNVLTPAPLVPPVKWTYTAEAASESNADAILAAASETKAEITWSASASGPAINGKTTAQSNLKASFGTPFPLVASGPSGVPTEGVMYQWSFEAVTPAREAAPIDPDALPDGMELSTSDGGIENDTLTFTPTSDAIGKQYTFTVMLVSSAEGAAPISATSAAATVTVSAFTPGPTVSADPTTICVGATVPDSDEDPAPAQPIVVTATGEGPEGADTLAWKYLVSATKPTPTEWTDAAVATDIGDTVVIDQDAKTLSYTPQEADAGQTLYVQCAYAEEGEDGTPAAVSDYSKTPSQTKIVAITQPTVAAQINGTGTTDAATASVGKNELEKTTLSVSAKYGTSSTAPAGQPELQYTWYQLEALADSADLSSLDPVEGQTGTELALKDLELDDSAENLYFACGLSFKDNSTAVTTATLTYSIEVVASAAQIDAVPAAQPSVVPLGYGADVSATVSGAEDGATCTWYNVDLTTSKPATIASWGEAVSEASGTLEEPAATATVSAVIFPTEAGTKNYSVKVQNPGANEAEATAFTTVTGVQLAAVDPTATSATAPPTASPAAVAAVAGTEVNLEAVWAVPNPTNAAELTKASTAPAVPEDLDWTSEEANVTINSGNMSATVILPVDGEGPATVKAEYAAQSAAPEEVSDKTSVTFTLNSVSLEGTVDGAVVAEASEPTTIAQFTGKAALGLQWSDYEESSYTPPLGGDKVTVDFSVSPDGSGWKAPTGVKQSADGSFASVNFSSNKAETYTITATVKNSAGEVIDTVDFEVEVSGDDVPEGLIFLTPDNNTVVINGDPSEPFTAMQPDPDDPNGDPVVVDAAGTWAVYSSNAVNEDTGAPTGKPIGAFVITPVTEGSTTSVTVSAPNTVKDGTYYLVYSVPATPASGDTPAVPARYSEPLEFTVLPAAQVVSLSGTGTVTLLDGAIAEGTDYQATVTPSSANGAEGVSFSWEIKDAAGEAVATPEEDSNTLNPADDPSIAKLEPGKYTVTCTVNVDESVKATYVASETAASVDFTLIVKASLVIDPADQELMSGQTGNIAVQYKEDSYTTAIAGEWTATASDDPDAGAIYISDLIGSAADTTPELSLTAPSVAEDVTYTLTFTPDESIADYVVAPEAAVVTVTPIEAGATIIAVTPTEAETSGAFAPITLHAQTAAAGEEEGAEPTWQDAEGTWKVTRANGSTRPFPWSALMTDSADTDAEITISPAPGTYTLQFTPSTEGAEPIDVTITVIAAPAGEITIAVDPAEAETTGVEAGTPVTLTANVADGNGGTAPAEGGSWSAAEGAPALTTDQNPTVVDTTGAQPDSYVYTYTPAEGDPVTVTVVVKETEIPSKDELQQAIDAAKEAADAVKPSEDGEGLAPGTQYAPQSAIDDLEAAIAAAQEVADNPDATADEIAQAAQDLAAAQKALEDATKTVEAVKSTLTVTGDTDGVAIEGVEGLTTEAAEGDTLTITAPQRAALAADAGTLTASANGAWNFTMPGQDAVITVTVLEENEMAVLQPDTPVVKEEQPEGSEAYTEGLQMLLTYNGDDDVFEASVILPPVKAENGEVAPTAKIIAEAQEGVTLQILKNAGTLDNPDMQPLGENEPIYEYDEASGMWMPTPAAVQLIGVNPMKKISVKITSGDGTMLTFKDTESSAVDTETGSDEAIAMYVPVTVLPELIFTVS